jgi:5'-3' exonuclease
MKRLLIDLGHLSHRLLFVQAPLIKEIGFGVLRHSLLANGIFPYISQFKPDVVYIGVDYKKSWRKELTTIYKANRAGAREKSSDMVNWEDFYKFMDDFTTELRQTFPFITPLVPTMEADDVIGWLTANLPKADDKIIVTGDTDYIQLLKYPNTKLWTPNKKAFVKCLDPERALLMKIICGDTSDNIPGCQRGVGPARAEKLIESGKFDEMMKVIDGDGKPCEFRRNFDRNQQLIDLTFIPDTLQKELQKQLVEYKPANGNGLFKYLIEHKLREMFDNIDRFRQLMKPLVDAQAVEAAPSAEKVLLG